MVNPIRQLPVSFLKLTLYLVGFLELLQIGAGMTVSILFSVLLLLLGVFLIRTHPNFNISKNHC